LRHLLSPIINYKEIYISLIQMRLDRGIFLEWDAKQEMKSSNSSGQGGGDSIETNVWRRANLQCHAMQLDKKKCKYATSSFWGRSLSVPVYIYILVLWLGLISDTIHIWIQTHLQAVKLSNTFVCYGSNKMETLILTCWSYR
jgi:hypothetical protein